MKVIIQRCRNASVSVNQNIVGSIERGLMVLVGFTTSDTKEIIDKMTHKVLNLRIFPDENNVMNKSILDVQEAILSVSQFTLYGDSKKGNRPSYIHALGGEEANILYQYWNEELKKQIIVETGMFGSDMDVTLTNVGPTTIIIEM